MIQENDKKELKPYLNQSNIISNSAIQINSATSMKLITYGLYKIAKKFDLKRYENMNLFDPGNWNEISWDDFSCIFSTKEFCNSLDLSDSGFLRGLIENAIEKAINERIKLDNQNETTWIPWFIKATYYHPTEKKEVKNNNICFTFHPGVLSIALGQTKNYTHIDLLNLGKLKSIYSIKWYEIIKSRYNMKGKWGNAPGTWDTAPMTIEDLKDLFNIDDKLYQGRNNNLLIKTVKNPIKEINNCGLNLQVELNIKRGSHNKIESFKLICKEVLQPRINNKTDTREEKLIKEQQNEMDLLSLSIEKMKETYPKEWDEISKTVIKNSEMPIFQIFVDQEIYSKMIENGFKI